MFSPFLYVNATNVYNKGKADGITAGSKFIIRAAASSTTGYAGLILSYDYLKQFSKVKPVFTANNGTVVFAKCNAYPTNNYIVLATFNNNQNNYLPTLSTNTSYLIEVQSQLGICELTFS